ncbi:MAG TPA: PHP domain-containing protein, partial [Chitinophagaceae bacterium]|nr:PHP domain-containing protein [Chitinophagaceae bacterium]
MYLNCKSNYSFRFGTFFTEELVKAGAALGVASLALTNINNTCDAWDFVAHCQKQNIKPILGAEIRNKNKFLYILIAANNKGFTQINKFLSDHHLTDVPFPEIIDQPFYNQTSDGYIIYPFNAKPLGQLSQNEFIGLLPSETNKLFRVDKKFLNEKFIIRQPVTFQNKSYYN